MQRPRFQTSDTFQVGGLLALVGGFLDAHTYISRGGVFAFAQTGNLIMLGIRISEGSLGQALRYLLPISAFILGVLAAELIRRYFLARSDFHWRQIVVAAEALILAAVSFIPQGELNTVSTTLISFLCAMQVESFRKFCGNSYSTTMCTGNLRSGTELLFHFCADRHKKDGKRSAQYYGIILLFVLGAVLGSLLTRLLSVHAALFGCLPLIGVFWLMYQELEPNREL